jgi:hypothetical protein
MVCVRIKKGGEEREEEREAISNSPSGSLREWTLSSSWA